MYSKITRPKSTQSPQNYYSKQSSPQISNNFIIPKSRKQAVFKSSMGQQYSQQVNNDQSRLHSVKNLIALGAPIQQTEIQSNKQLKLIENIQINKEQDKMITYNLLELQYLLLSSKSRTIAINQIILLAKKQFKFKTGEYKPINFNLYTSKRQKLASIIKNEKQVVNNALEDFLISKRKQSPVGSEFVDYIYNLKVSNGYNVQKYQSLDDIQNDILVEFIHYFNKVLLKAKIERLM